MAHTTDADNADIPWTLATSSASTIASIPGPPPPAAAVMDPEGDVILIIPTADKRKVRFQVNSGALCVASPVFRAMIGRHSRFKEASALAAKRANGSEDPYEITLGDDNPNALAVVLRIIHMKHYLVPQVLDEDQLYEVAVICDKYGMNQAVMVWAGNVWIPFLTWDESSKVTGHKWLFIAYVFRRHELFYALSQDIILSATTKTDEPSTLVMTANDGTETNVIYQALY